MSAALVARGARRRLRHNPLVRSLRAAALTGLDGLERVVVRGAADCPPRRLRGVGAGDFRAVGEQLAGQLVSVGGLRTDDRVLDIGCGSGRLALPLTRYLRGGSYAGFDIDADMIAWCRRAIGTRHPNFAFEVVDAANTHYNPAGAMAAESVRFPYGAAEFRFAVATSLFTHLLPASLANYLAEAARALAPGGTLFATFCLVGDEERALVARGAAHVDLRHRVRDRSGVEYHTLDPASPETAVGYAEDHVRAALATAGLHVSAVHRGTWPGRADGLSFQDVVIAERRAAAAPVAT